LPSQRAETGEPHVGQNPRDSLLPESVVTVWYFCSAPSKVIRSLATSTDAAVALPLARWQSLQWQIS